MENHNISSTPNTQHPAPSTQHPTPNFYWDAFKTFFKIGAFTLGGGYAMLSIIQNEVVDKKKWIPKEQFIDLVAVAQSCPGVFAANISIFVGYKMRKTPGALCTCLGAILPSFLIILCIALFFHQFMNLSWVAAMFRGIRPAVVALIAAPTFTLAKSAHISLSNCWIPIVTALLIWKLGVNPVYIIIAAGLGGYLYGKFIKPTE
ncbi:MAG: chromate transporter [Prevotella sp.]|nr:chromate transporter [Prevotella sp.]